MKKYDEKRGKGRPREFDRDAALRAAMLLFWKQGYETTSLEDLTEAMNISKPTLYATFKNKENLLHEAVSAYIGLRAGDYAAALKHPTSKGAAEAWLRLTGGVRHEMEVPSGCLVVQGALVGSPASESVRSELAAIRNEGTRQLEKRFQKAKREGDLPGTWDPESLAQYLSAVVAGLAVQSSTGIPPAVLNKVIDQVMANWPASPKR
jgi:AcrR family transcriptional regulator